MAWWECALIICGISFDVFTQMERQGAMIAQIKAKEIIKLSSIVLAFQLVAFFIGHRLANFICIAKDLTGSELILGQLTATVIMIALGVRQIVKARKMAPVQEKRESGLSEEKMVGMLSGLLFFTILTGIALAFTGAETLELLLSVILISVIAVVAGVFFGYRNGVVHMEKAHYLGAALLIVIGIELMIKCLLGI